MNGETHPPAVVNVGLVQTHATEDATDNLERTLVLVRKAAGEGAGIVCLQELFRTPYFCQEEDARFFDLAESIPGPTTEALAAVAKERGITVLGSVFEKRAPGLFHNTAVLLRPDGSLGGTYRKMHIPDDPRFYEKFYFTPGDLGFRAFDTAVGRIGTLVCWDQWYPEAARLTAMAGAKILFYPTAIGTWTGESELMAAQHEAWRTVQRAHAITNGVFVVAVNRVGREGDLQFWGRSFVARPDGSIAAEADDSEAVVVVACDLTQVDEAREGWPFLRDRRIDAYGDLTKRFLDTPDA
ncbi:MAG: carbon-nitrogen hydrolase [Planctomycetota bacterium]|jgi:N-carbamoylputrescine amidase